MHHPSSPEPIEGREEVREFLAQFRAGMLRLQVEDLVEGDRAAAVRWSARGTHDEELFGIPATGRDTGSASSASRTA